MEKKMDIYSKLKNIQQELKAPKGQYNSFGKYSYRSCEDIFEAVKPLLNKYDLILQVTDELQYIGERYYVKANAMLIDDTGTIVNVGYAREEETKKGMDGSQITGASSSYARKYALNGLFLIDDTKDSDATNVGEEVTKEQALEFKFGEKTKHPNQTILEVYKEDKGYLQYWLDRDGNETLKKMIQMVTDMKPTDVPQTEEDQNKKLLLIEQLNKLVFDTGTNYANMLKHYKVKSNGEMTIEQLEDAIKKLEMK